MEASSISEGALRRILYAWSGLDNGVSDALAGAAEGDETGVSWSWSFTPDSVWGLDIISATGKNVYSELSSSWRGEMGVGKGELDLGASEGARVGVRAVGPTLPVFILKESDNGGSVCRALREGVLPPGAAFGSMPLSLDA